MLGLLDGLGSEELLLLLLSLELLCSFFGLELLELFSALVRENLFLLTLFLGSSNFAFKLKVLLQLFLANFFLLLELFQKLLLLLILLELEV